MKWNSAPVGVLMLGAVGAIYFFCKCCNSMRIRDCSLADMTSQAWIWFQVLTTGRMKCLVALRH